MITVETIGRVRRDFHIKGKGIRAIARDRRLSRNTVRKIVRGEEVAPIYERQAQPLPKLGAHAEQLEAMLEANAGKPRRERLTATRIFELLQGEGYDGGYDAVRRYVKRWRKKRSKSGGQAFVPLVFAPGEAYQFDWSHEVVVLAGVVTKVKVGHMRLCHSRMPFVCAFPREAQEMVFEAHARAFTFFGGVCERGIYDNMKTAVDAVFIAKKARSAKSAGATGPQKDRQFNRRFLAMCSHYLVEPTACTPAAGWEKGQVENQVGTIRERFFTPRLKFDNLEELNAWLAERCITYAKEQSHPESKDKTVWEMFEVEKTALIEVRGPFDGFRATPAAVSKTCLVCFDRNRYSVMSKAVGRPVDVYAYADRIVIRQDGEVVGEHTRCFARGETIYDPWHYVPILERKPGALRNGAPFKDWELPKALVRVRRKLAGVEDGNRQMVDILTAALSDGLDAVEAACAQALNDYTFSADVILNILARQAEPAPCEPIATPAGLQLAHAPKADCARYDDLRTPRGEPATPLGPWVGVRADARGLPDAALTDGWPHAAP